MNTLKQTQGSNGSQIRQADDERIVIAVESLTQLQQLAYFLLAHRIEVAEDSQLIPSGTERLLNDLLIDMLVEKL